LFEGRDRPLVARYQPSRSFNRYRAELTLARAQINVSTLRLKFQLGGKPYLLGCGLKDLGALEEVIYQGLDL
jgi:hypothetical protein